MPTEHRFWADENGENISASNTFSRRKTLKRPKEVWEFLYKQKYPFQDLLS